MKFIPFALILSRIPIGLIILWSALFAEGDFSAMAPPLIALGIITDIFDGIIARRLGISNKKMRIWDSNVDQVFWALVIVSVFIVRFTIIKPLLLFIGILVLLESITYIISYARFKKPVATHTILAKIWALSLLGFLIEAAREASTYSFIVCFVIGVISRIEIILILSKLKKWTIDVPSYFSVAKLNRGEEIKRNKWFNG